MAAVRQGQQWCLCSKRHTATGLIGRVYVAAMQGYDAAVTEVVASSVQSAFAEMPLHVMGVAAKWHEICSSQLVCQWLSCCGVCACMCVQVSAAGVSCGLPVCSSSCCHPGGPCVCTLS